jgi:flagellum-specific peptidoglycan hydrolase FlgJ
MARALIIFLGFFLFTSCGTQKVFYSSSDKRIAKKIDKKSERSSAKKLAEMDATTRMKVYVIRYAPLAEKEMKKFGIPASITLAQGLLESQAGVGVLAVKSNNHFGIKCHNGWRGPRVSHDDDAKGECFRKYKKVEQSYRDHSEFLRYRDRYSKLFKMKKTDYINWAHELKKAGYATDPRYAYKLISLIERYDLWKFDGSKGPIKSKANNKNNLKSYIVKKGDTLFAIAKRFKVTLKTLKDINSLISNEISIGQELRLK